MKYSKSVLENVELRKKLFSYSISKVEKLVKDIFLIDLKSNVPGIKEVIKDESLYLYRAVFLIDEREIIISLEYRNENDNFVQEVLSVKETVEEDIPLNLINEDYESATNKVLDILENKYNLEFTPLDPEDLDKNIKDIKNNDENKSLEIIFTNDNHEANFKAIFMYRAINSTLTVMQFKNHVIYLE